MKAHFILYVSDQTKSTAFYSSVLDCSATLNVPGMTEFSIGEQTVLGLMPEAGAERLFGDEIDLLVSAGRSPRAEVYLMVDTPEAYHLRSIENGGREISPLLPRDWGHIAAYSLDPDGYVLAFAKVISDK